MYSLLSVLTEQPSHPSLQSSPSMLVNIAQFATTQQLAPSSRLTTRSKSGGLTNPIGKATIQRSSSIPVAACARLLDSASIHTALASGTVDQLTPRSAPQPSKLAKKNETVQLSTSAMSVQLHAWKNLPVKARRYVQSGMSLIKPMLIVYRSVKANSIWHGLAVPADGDLGKFLREGGDCTMRSPPELG